MLGGAHGPYPCANVIRCAWGPATHSDYPPVGVTEATLPCQDCILQGKR